MAITSISMHLVVQKRNSQAERDNLQARISILSELVRQLNSDEKPSPGEVERQLKLARQTTSGDTESSEGEIGWREVIFGRQAAPDSSYDAKDIHKCEYVQ
jgi:hypothetical protein